MQNIELTENSENLLKLSQYCSIIITTKGTKPNKEKETEMKKLMYKVVFNVTETLQNGKERRVQKVVYMPRFDEVTKKHISPEQQIERGIAALKEQRYYDIQYGSTIATEIIFA